MADEEYDVEDITPSNSSDDSDSDDENGGSNASSRPRGNRIAHKEMRNIEEENEPRGQEGKQNEEESKNIDSESETNISAKQSANFEDISDEDEENEAFSPAEDNDVGDDDGDDNIESPLNESNEKVEDNDSAVSDDEEIEKDDNSRIFSDDDEKDDNSRIVSDDDENSNDQQYAEEEIVKDKAKSNDNEDADDDYINAPIPSPFSDIGEISGAEKAMINDILKETSDADHISPELEGFANSIESADLQITSPNAKNKDVEGEIVKPESKDLVEKESSNAVNPDLGKDEKNTEGPEQSGGDVGGLIADIFGDSDDEDEEFEGFGEDELRTERMKLKSRAIISDEEEDSDDDGEKPVQEKSGIIAEAEREQEAENEIGKVPLPDDEESSDDDKPSDRQEIVSDFDLMMQRKKEAMSSRRTRKRDFDIINDNDDIIAAMIRSMREAAEEDRMLNQAGKAATRKLKMLDSVVSHLNKSDLQHTFIDGGVLPVMKDWLTPLPDNSLPHVMIRKKFLKLLSEFPSIDTGALKMSGIGRAVMLLCKHPKETRENRTLAGKIVARWARPIFGVQTNFKDVSKEEREERDRIYAAEHKKRRLSSTDDYPGEGSDAQDEKRPKRPGDKGFIPRARVPRASSKDYVVRPKSDIGLAEMGNMKHTKKSMDRFEKQMRKFKDRKGLKGSMQAVSISINGSKMAL